MDSGKSAGLIFAILFVLGISLAINFYSTVIYPTNIAAAEINNAQSAGYPDQVIEKINKAKEMLSNFHGNPCWIFPTDYTDWDEIKKALDQNILRLEKLIPLNDTDDAFQQGMDDVRGKLRVIADRVSAAQEWLWISVINIMESIAWCIVEIILGVYAYENW